MITITQKKDELTRYFELQQFDSFFSIVDDVLTHLKQHDMLEEYITFVIHKAVVYFRLKNLTLASHELSEIAKIIEEHATAPQKIRYYNTLASIQNETKNYEQAYQYLTTAQYLAEKVDDKKRLIQIYHNLSLYFYNNGDLENSLLYAKKSIAYDLELPERTNNYLQIMLDFVVILLKAMQIEEAMQVLNQVKPIIEQADINQNYVKLRITESFVLEAQGQINHSYSLLLKTIAQCQQDIHWLEELYGRLCQLSKQRMIKEDYLNDLKNYMAVKLQVSEQQKKEQLAAVHLYIDDHSMKIASWTDPLTKIHNRRYIEENYPHYEQPFAVMLFDFDRFKSINDTYGHFAGDLALQAVATLASMFFKEWDAHIVRLGGDEFFGVFPITSQQLLHEVLQAFLQEVRALKIPFESGFLSLTISIGALFCTNPLSFEQALAKTDVALYHSKESGRNQYTVLDQGSDLNDFI